MVSAVFQDIRRNIASVNLPRLQRQNAENPLGFAIGCIGSVKDAYEAASKGYFKAASVYSISAIAYGLGVLLHAFLSEEMALLNAIYRRFL